MKTLFTLTLSLLYSTSLTFAQEKAAPVESDYYTITPIQSPEGIVPEISGIEIGPDKELYAATRRGDIYQIQNAYPGTNAKPTWNLWAQGLHEPLGLSWHDGWLWATQRPEVTKMKDADGDGRADLFHTVSDHWGIDGNYHEYAFGSRHDKDGNIWVTLCLTGSSGYSSDFRGWCVRITPDGKMIPTTSGIRSPGGMGVNPAGDMFYCDNQGLWNGSSSLKHLKIGSFQGNPKSFPAFDELDANLLGGKPVEPKDKSRMETERTKVAQLVPPAVILPHGKLGQSPTGIAYFPENGKFGPFEGQLIVGEQTHSQLQRVFLEKVNGVYQGAAFHFLSEFESGNTAVRVDDETGVVFTGGSNRGWGARGGKAYNLESVKWNGKVPFEVHEMRAKADGFELTFTKPVDPKTAGDTASYKIKAYTYIYQSVYGSPEVDGVIPVIKSATVAADAKSVHLVLDKLTKGHVHELQIEGVKSASGNPLLHQFAYYTLNEIPGRPATKVAEPKAKDKPKPLAPGGVWARHSMDRPRPRVVTPPAPGKAPSDAVVFFDGSDLSKWRSAKPSEDGGATAKWKVENNYMEVVPGTGVIQTRDEIDGDAQWHIEWATPAEVKGNGQGRGNSGVFITGFPEVQVLDSYNNDTYPDGQAAGLYGQYPPMVNASRKPGEWQAYDIIVIRQKKDDKGKVSQPGSITVLHNGIVVHFARQVGGHHPRGGLGLQDHGNPTRFRNIWARKINLVNPDSEGTPPPEKK